MYTRKIYRANKYDGSDLVAMTTRLPTQPSGISTVVKTQRQQCSNPCDQFNGGCSHICAPGKGAEQEEENKYLVTMTETTMARTLGEGGCEGIYYLQEEKEIEILDLRLFIKWTKDYFERVVLWGFCSVLHGLAL